MVLGIGIDTVDIERFEHWHTFSHARLQRIFSEQEIEYCLSIEVKSTERFAARFAVREAFLKALSSAAPETRLSLLWISKHMRVISHPNRAPQLMVDWGAIKAKIPSFQEAPRCSISLSHSKELATAIVIIEST